MSAAQIDRWTETEAFRDYRDRHDAQAVRAVVDRAVRVASGRGREGEREKVESFIKRMKAVDAGEAKNGSGPSAVSDRTAALRNWGFDPTGRFS